MRVADRPPHSTRQVGTRTPEELEQRIQSVSESLAALETYLITRIRVRDWHGVEDAASDIRDHEAELRALRWTAGGDA